MQNWDFVLPRSRDAADQFNISRDEEATLRAQIQQLECLLHHQDSSADVVNAIATLVGLCNQNSFVPQLVSKSMGTMLGEITLARLDSNPSEEEIMPFVTVLHLLAEHEVHAELMRLLNLPYLLLHSFHETEDENLRILLHKLSSRVKGKIRERKTSRFFQFETGPTTGGEPFIIEIKQTLYSSQNLAWGWKVWDSAAYLAQWIEHNGPQLFKGKVAMELGCGVGLCSAIAARHTRTLYATDYLSELLHNLTLNLSNKSDRDGDGDDSDSDDPRVQIVQLDWTDPTTWPRVAHEKVDIIFASDVVYNMIGADHIPRVVSHFLSEEGVACFILPPVRHGIKQFESNMKAAGLVCQVARTIDNSLCEDEEQKVLHFYLFRWPSTTTK